MHPAQKKEKRPAIQIDRQPLRFKIAKVALR